MSYSRYSNDQDHLHIRGENEMAHSGNLLKLGSPPHTWRKFDAEDTGNKQDRITSTYVEKIVIRLNTLEPLQDHLHIRGENYQFLGLMTLNIGSPPHTWRKYF